MRPCYQAATYRDATGLVQAICKEKGEKINGVDDDACQIHGIAKFIRPGAGWKCQIQRLVGDDPGHLGDEHVQGSEGNGLVGCILGR